MLIQEPVQAAIWHCLNHYAYNDAIFLAERLRAEVESEETIWLLATCYYRSGKLAQAYSLLKNSTSPQCKFLFARCCIDLQKISEAENVLMGSDIGRGKTTEEIANEYGEMAAFTLTLMASVCFQTERHQKGIDASRKALLLNPFLWTVFETLCKKGDRPDPTKTFALSGLEEMSTVTGSNAVINFVNSRISTPDFNNSNHGLNVDNNVNLSTPIQVVNMSNLGLSGIRAFTPDNTHPLPLPPVAQPKRSIRYRIPFQGSISPLTPSFGVIPLDRSNDSFHSLNTLSEVNDQKVNTKRQILRKETPLQQTKPVFHQSAMNTPSGAVRRSSRLYSNSYAVKENAKSPNRNKFATPNSPSRKVKSKLSKQSITRANNCSELNERNRSSESIVDSPVINPRRNSKSITEQAMILQTNSLEGLSLLMSVLGQGYLHLLQYECKKAIEIFDSLPPHHRNTGWVLAMLGKAYFEMYDYKKASSIFQELRKIEQERCTHMAYYSTALWHLQKDAALSSLAQDLTSLDKHAPEAWCAAGNCYSLQKEHDIAIKFFQRAVQVDPNFAYAYTLLGHEYVVTEELDKGMSCFRNAVRLDTRHYNAWYGIGTIYSKQEKYLLAELHYKRALSINPNSCILMCHIGVVQMALKQKDKALETLNRALQIEPNNPLCKFHRASILASCNRHHEALTELDELKELVPKESLVYYLTGKVHKKLGNTHLALMHFSWATDLDPKGASTQIKDTIDPGISHIHDIGGDSSTDDLLRTPSQEPPGEMIQDNDDSF